MKFSPCAPIETTDLPFALPQQWLYTLLPLLSNFALIIAQLNAHVTHAGRPARRLAQCLGLWCAFLRRSFSVLRPGFFLAQ